MIGSRGGRRFRPSKGKVARRAGRRAGKHLEVECGRAAFDAADHIGIVGGVVAELAEQKCVGLGGSAEEVAIFRGGGIARAAREEPADVVKFAGDEAAGEGGRAGRIASGGVLRAAQHHRALGHALHAGFEPAPIGEVADARAVFPAEAHGGGRDVDIGAKDEDGFEIMDGQREFELFLVFDAQGEPIAAEREAGGEQVENVLEGLHAGRDFRFEISNLRFAVGKGTEG